MQTDIDYVIYEENYVNLSNNITLNLTLDFADSSPLVEFQRLVAIQ